MIYLSSNYRSDALNLSVPQTHLDTDTVRSIALTPTRGLGRGMPVEDSGHGLVFPVGEALLGRMLNVFGDPSDGKGPIAASEQMRSQQSLRLLEYFAQGF